MLSICPDERYWVDNSGAIPRPNERSVGGAVRGGPWLAPEGVRLPMIDGGTAC